jgi:hypothetical protein
MYTAKLKGRHRELRKTLRICALLFGALGASSAKAGTACTVPNSVTLDILPTGCGTVLTNGPIFYNGVLATGGDTFNIEVDSMELFGLNSGANTVDVYLKGISTDVTTSSTMSFALLSTTTFFQTNPLSNTYSANTGTHTFGIAHFIDSTGGGTLKLNFGESGKPSQSALDMVSSSATTGVGTFIVTSSFDLYTELTLNGGTNYTAASDDFIGTDSGPGALLSIENVPEPASAALFASGLAVLRLVRRRKNR